MLWLTSKKLSKHGTWFFWIYDSTKIFGCQWTHCNFMVLASRWKTASKTRDLVHNYLKNWHIWEILIDLWLWYNVDIAIFLSYQNSEVAINLYFWPPPKKRQKIKVVGSKNNKNILICTFYQGHKSIERSQISRFLR